MASTLAIPDSEEMMVWARVHGAQTKEEAALLFKKRYLAFLTRSVAVMDEEETISGVPAKTHFQNQIHSLEAELATNASTTSLQE